MSKNYEKSSLVVITS